jgi:HK97 family phage major capsid protein
MAVEAKTMEQLVSEMSIGVADLNTKMSSKLDEFGLAQKSLTDRMDTLETKGNMPPGLVAKEKGDDIEEKWMEDYQHYLFTKSSYDELTWIKEYVATHTKRETPTGGYWMPSTMSNRIIEVIVNTSPIRSIASVETLQNGDELTMVQEVGTMPCGWTSEVGAKPATANMTTAEVKIPTHPMYAMPLMTQKMARTAAFNVESWMTRRVTEYYGFLEGVAFVTGSGTGRPQGVLTAANKAATNVVHVHTAAAATIPDFDCLIDCQEHLPEQYQSNATWIMNRATKAALRMMQDGLGRYILEQNVMMGYGVNATPISRDMLFGHPITYVPAMQNIGAAVGGVNVKPIMYGDFREAYTIVDNPGIYTIRDEVTTKGLVSLFSERLGVGGGVVNEAAYVPLECSV